jgi:hypothetical protein
MMLSQSGADEGVVHSYGPSSCNEPEKMTKQETQNRTNPNQTSRNSNQKPKTNKGVSKAQCKENGFALTALH